MYDLSIILPVHNEKETIELVLQEWKKELENFPLKYKLVICEDGSTDGTQKLLLKIRKKYRLILNQKAYRRGYGQAVIDGIKTADSKYILCVDSDGQCDPKDFKNFWLKRNQDKVIIGWRRQRADPIERKLFSFLFKIWFKLSFPSNIRDPSCSYVLFRKKTILPFLKYLNFMNEGFWWG